MMEDNAVKRNRQIKQEKQVKALADAYQKSTKNKIRVILYNVHFVCNYLLGKRRNRIH